MADDVAPHAPAPPRVPPGWSKHDRLGLVLSGGGARGMFQAGALQEILAEEKLGKVTILSGTSAGAINAALLAHSNRVEDLLSFWHEAAKDQPIRATPHFYEDLYGSLEELMRVEGVAIVGERGYWSTLRGLVTSRKNTAGDLLGRTAVRLLKQRFPKLIRAIEAVPEASFFDHEQLRDRLVKRLGTRVTPRKGVSLVVSVVDAHEGTVVRFTTKRPLTGTDKEGEYSCDSAIPIDAILASASIPMLLPAVRTTTKTQSENAPPVERERLCWDGGLLVNTPLAPAVDLDSQRVLTILCTVGRVEAAPAFSSLNHALERLADTFFENTYNVDRKLLLTRNLVAMQEVQLKQRSSTYRHVWLHKPVRPGPGDVRSYVDFTPESIDAMYESGRRVARNWIREEYPIEDEIDVAPTPPRPLGD